MFLFDGCVRFVEMCSLCGFGWFVPVVRCLTLAVCCSLSYFVVPCNCLSLCLGLLEALFLLG